jgi:hypothetical protein
VDDFQPVRTGLALRGDVQPERADLAAGPAGLPIEIDRILAQKAVHAAVVDIAPNGQLQDALGFPARWQAEVLAVERRGAGGFFLLVPKDHRRRLQPGRCVILPQERSRLLPRRGMRHAPVVIQIEMAVERRPGGFGA